MDNLFLILIFIIRNISQYIPIVHLEYHLNSMDPKFYEASYHTPTNKSIVGSSMLFDPTSPTDSSTSVRRFERKPDLNRKKNNSRSKKDNNSTMFAGFYSPKQFNRTNVDVPEIRTSNILKDVTVLTRRENIEFLSAKDMMIENSSIAVKKGVVKPN